MQKAVISILLVTSSVLSGTNASAIKYPVRTIKNLKNLERVIADVSRNPHRGVIVQVPTSVVSSGKIVLTKARTPRDFSPVTASLITYRKNAAFDILIWGKEFPVLTPDNQLLKKEILVGRGYYTNATKLARDLNFFYHGVAPVMEGPYGQKVKFYTLPVDGILYKPTGYTKPLVLNSEEYFVIYDIETYKGEIVENKPYVCDNYKLVSWSNKSAQAAGPTASSQRVNQAKPKATVHHLLSRRQAGETLPLAEEHTPRLSAEESLQMFNQYRQDVVQFRQTGQAEQLWQNAGLDKQYATGVLLGQAVIHFYNLHTSQLPSPVSVKHVATGKVGKIYEFPVEGLEIKLKNGNTVVVNPEEVILFYSQDNVFRLLERKQQIDSHSLEIVTE